MTYSRVVEQCLEQGDERQGYVDRIIRNFDTAILGCSQKDVVRTVKSLGALERTLDLQAFPELARSFLSIFHYCVELTRKRRFEDVSRYLRPLRDVWHRALKQRDTARG